MRDEPDWPETRVLTPVVPVPSAVMHVKAESLIHALDTHAVAPNEPDGFELTVPKLVPWIVTT